MTLTEHQYGLLAGLDEALRRAKLSGALAAICNEGLIHPEAIIKFREAVNTALHPAVEP